jgi:hypothetical protein
MSQWFCTFHLKQVNCYEDQKCVREERNGGERQSNERDEYR